MSFRVYGISHAQMLKKAHKTVSVRDDKGNMKPEQEWLAECRAAADKWYADSTAERPVSDVFDAPQYASEFIALARKTGARMRGLHVRAIYDTGKKTKKGAPVKEWRRYAP